MTPVEEKEFPLKGRDSCKKVKIKEIGWLKSNGSRDRKSVV